MQRFLGPIHTGSVSGASCSTVHSVVAGYDIKDHRRDTCYCGNYNLSALCKLQKSYCMNWVQDCIFVVHSVQGCVNCLLWCYNSCVCEVINLCFGRCSRVFWNPLVFFAAFASCLSQTCSVLCGSLWISWWDFSFLGTCFQMVFAKMSDIAVNLTFLIWNL